MKRSIAILMLFVVLTAAVAACATTVPQAPSAAPQVVKETVVVKETSVVQVTPQTAGCKPEDYVYVGTSPLIHPYLTNMNAAAEQAGKDLNRKVIWLSASFYDLDKQIGYIEQAGTFPCLKGLTSVAADPNSLEAATTAIAERGVAVAQTGACPEKGVAPICFATSYPAIGGGVAKKLGDLMGGKGNVVIARSVLSDANEQQRITAFKDVMGKDFPNIKIVDEIPNCATPEGTTACAEQALSTHPEMNAYWSVISQAALGAVTAFKGANRSDIIIVGADDEPEMLEAIKNGTIAFSFSQQPFGQGYLMVYLPYLMAEKGLKPTARFLEMGLTMIDKSNIDTYKADVDANWKKIKEYVDTTLMK